MWISISALIFEWKYETLRFEELRKDPAHYRWRSPLFIVIFSAEKEEEAVRKVQAFRGVSNVNVASRAVMVTSHQPSLLIQIWISNLSEDFYSILTVIKGTDSWAESEGWRWCFVDDDGQILPSFQTDRSWSLCWLRRRKIIVRIIFRCFDTLAIPSDIRASFTWSYEVSVPSETFCPGDPILYSWIIF